MRCCGRARGGAGASGGGGDAALGAVDRGARAEWLVAVERRRRWDAIGNFLGDVSDGDGAGAADVLCRRGRAVGSAVGSATRSLLHRTSCCRVVEHRGCGFCRRRCLRSGYRFGTIGSPLSDLLAGASRNFLTRPRRVRASMGGVRNKASARLVFARPQRAGWRSPHAAGRRRSLATPLGNFTSI